MSNRVSAIATLGLSLVIGLVAQTKVISPSFANTTNSPAGRTSNGHLLAVIGSQNLSPQKRAELALRQLGEPIHRSKCAAADLVRECRQDAGMLEGGEIDFIGGDIIPIFPGTADGMGGPEYLPPRKKYLDLHVNQLSLLIPILKEDITNLTMPDAETQTKEAPQIASMQGLLTDARKHFRNLQMLCKQPPFDNTAIANEATGLHGTLCQIDKLRKDIYGAVKHDPDKESKQVPSS